MKSRIFLCGVRVIILLVVSMEDVTKKWVLGRNSQREYGVKIGYEKVITRMEVSNKVVLELLNEALNCTVP